MWVACWLDGRCRVGLGKVVVARFCLGCEFGGVGRVRICFL